MARKGFSHRFLLVLATAALMVGCHEDNPVDPDENLFDDVQLEVFNKSCVDCHSGSSPPAGLTLEEGAAYDAIVGVASTQRPELNRVKPNDPNNSYLFIKITGDDRIAPNTFRMPIGGSLSDEQIQLVEDWIAAGAKH